MTYKEAFAKRHPDLTLANERETCYYTCPDDAGLCPHIDSCPHDPQGKVSCRYCWDREMPTEEAIK